MFFLTYAFNLHCTKNKKKLLKEKGPVSEFKFYDASGITVCVICDRHTWTQYSNFMMLQVLLFVLYVTDTHGIA